MLLVTESLYQRSLRLHLHHVLFQALLNSQITPGVTEISINTVAASIPGSAAQTPPMLTTLDASSNQAPGSVRYTQVITSLSSLSSTLESQLAPLEAEMLNKLSLAHTPTISECAALPGIFEEPVAQRPADFPVDGESKKMKTCKSQNVLVKQNRNTGKAYISEKSNKPKPAKINSQMAISNCFSCKKKGLDCPAVTPEARHIT